MQKKPRHKHDTPIFSIGQMRNFCAGRFFGEPLANVVWPECPCGCGTNWACEQYFRKLYDSIDDVEEDAKEAEA